MEPTLVTTQPTQRPVPTTPYQRKPVVRRPVPTIAADIFAEMKALGLSNYNWFPKSVRKGLGQTALRAFFKEMASAILKTDDWGVSDIFCITAGSDGTLMADVWTMLSGQIDLMEQNPVASYDNILELDITA